jgi:hypothetical protein
MRCSDCKSFKTEECTVNPKGEDCCSAEIFACFKSSAGDEIQSTSTNTGGNGKKTDSLILFWVGIIGIVMGFGFAWGTFSSMPNMDTPEDFPIIIAGIIIGMVGCFITIIGALLYFVRRSQEKRQRNSCDTHD